MFQLLPAKAPTPTKPQFKAPIMTNTQAILAKGPLFIVIFLYTFDLY